MRDSTLIKLSLVWAIIGIFILLCVSTFAQPKQGQIKDIENNLGNTIVVTANISSISYTSSAVFLTLQDSTGSVPAVFFGNMTKISKGHSAMVKGKVQLYKGDDEIVVGEIACLDCS